MYNLFIFEPVSTRSTGFLPGIFSGGKIYCYANFFCYANFLLFSDQISGGGKSLRGGANCLGGGLLPPCGRKPKLKKLEFMRMLENSMSFEGVRWRVSGIG